MKNWVKNCMIAAACLAGVGILMAGSGMALGGLRVEAAEVAAGTGENLPYRIDPEGIRSLEVSWVEGNVLLEPWDGEKILLEEQSGKTITEKHRLHWELDGDTLEVEYLRDGFRFPFRKPAEKDLRIRLPRALADSLEELEIENVSAEWSLQNLTADSLDMTTVSGDIRGLGLTAREVEMETVSGDFQLQFASCPRQVEAESVSGDAELMLPRGSEVRAELDSVSGDLESQLPMTTAGGDAWIRMESVSGDLQIRESK